MSSHQLSNDQYQLISDWLCTQAMERNSPHYFCVKSFIGFEHENLDLNYPSDETVCAAVKIKVRNLYNLNRLALTTCYGHEYQREDFSFFRPVYNNTITEKKAIQTLQSLRYQCNEYLTCDTNLYQELKNFIGQLCENIFDRIC